MKNINLIDRLLQSLIIANEGKINLKDLEKYLDNLVNKHKLYMEFPDQQLEWHIEDYAEAQEKTFFSMIERMSSTNEMMTLTLTSHCDNCNERLIKKSSSGSKHVLNCKVCRVDYTFELVHTAGPVGEVIDEDESDLPI